MRSTPREHHQCHLSSGMVNATGDSGYHKPRDPADLPPDDHPPAGLAQLRLVLRRSSQRGCLVHPLPSAERPGARCLATPCLATPCVDKPMLAVNLPRAIARVRRVFKDKSAGLVVNCIGIAPSGAVNAPATCGANSIRRGPSGGPFRSAPEGGSPRRRRCRHPLERGSGTAAMASGALVLWRHDCVPAGGPLQARYRHPLRSVPRRDQQVPPCQSADRAAASNPIGFSSARSVSIGKALFRRTAIRNIEVARMIEARLPLPWPHKENQHARRGFISKAPL